MFTINDQKWEIKYATPCSRNLQRSDGSLTVGVTDLKDGVIYLSTALSGAFLRKVLIHELTHAAMFSYGIFVDLDTEELICDLIASHGDEIIGLADKIFKGIKRIA